MPATQSQITDPSLTDSAAVEHKARLSKTFAYYAAFVVLGLAAAVTGPTLPGLAEHVRSTIGQISYLFVLRSLGYLIGSLLAGRLYDRVKGHPLIILVICIVSAVMAAVPVIPALWLLAAALAFLGVAEGILDVGGNTLLVWVHREKMGPYMNGLHFFFGLGAFFSPMIVALAIERTQDIYWAYWVLALLMLPSAFWLSRLPSPSAILHTETAPLRRALPVLIGLIAVFNFLYVGAEVAFGGWVYTYATALKLGSLASAALLTSAFWGALTAGRLLSIPIAIRFSPRTVLSIDLAILVSSLVLILLLPASVTALWIGTLGVGFGMSSIFPTMLAIAERHMTITGFVTSWFFVGSSLGGMTLPWIIGQLFDPIGPQVVMYAITINIVLDLLIFAAMMVYTQRIARKAAAAA
jgi:MFS transporter, FHS family, Na+ dependent glucose transporter 1